MSVTLCDSRITVKIQSVHYCLQGEELFLQLPAEHTFYCLLVIEYLAQLWTSFIFHHCDWKWAKKTNLKSLRSARRGISLDHVVTHRLCKPVILTGIEMVCIHYALNTSVLCAQISVCFERALKPRFSSDCHWASLGPMEIRFPGRPSRLTQTVVWSDKTERCVIGVWTLGLMGP